MSRVRGVHRVAPGRLVFDRWNDQRLRGWLALAPAVRQEESAEPAPGHRIVFAVDGVVGVTRLALLDQVRRDQRVRDELQTDLGGVCRKTAHPADDSER